MHALFVHGMGRTPLSGFLLMRRLRKRGITTSTFFYSVTFQSFASIEARLRKRIEAIAGKGEYILIGHSLGGVLIRSALSSLPPATRMPNQVFVMGSPVSPSRIAKYLRRNWLFWLLTRDCGDLLSSDERMRKIAPCPVRTTSFVGTRGISGRLSPFGDEINDSIVSASEIAADWIAEEIQVPVYHSWMMHSKKIAEAIVNQIESDRQRNQVDSATGHSSTS